MNHKRKKINRIKVIVSAGVALLLVLIALFANVIAPNGKQVYKEYFDKVKEVLKDNELCNI